MNKDTLTLLFLLGICIIIYIIGGIAIAKLSSVGRIIFLIITNLLTFILTTIFIIYNSDKKD